MARVADAGHPPLVGELHHASTPASAPAEHGLHYPFQWKPEEQRVRYADAFPYPETIWDRASRSGRRVLIVDPYEAPPAAAVNGLAVSGWQFTNRVVLTPWSVPSLRGGT